LNFFLREKAIKSQTIRSKTFLKPTTGAISGEFVSSVYDTATVNQTVNA